MKQIDCMKWLNGECKSKIGAFTLSELLIALGVIAILTAISMPIIHNLLPDQNVVMAKRAF
ncbi:MAG: prepilin-type N-terminal cleavage/methylation domain-containing protein, partial [Cyanobacteriota bacterium]|nr:prepilin-type N-terminal cleavage/methylation domain-containing protein [Cyanobacteriota bacterium]